MEMGAALLPYCRVLVVCGEQITEGMKQEIMLTQRLGIEICTLENIPTIPTLDNYRDDLTGLDNLNIALSLIEGMTGGRFMWGVGGTYIHPDTNSYYAVNKLVSFDRDDMFFRVRFNAHLQTMGRPMNADGVLKLQRETARIHELLTLLDSRQCVLTPEEITEFDNSIKQRGAPITEKPSVIKQIAAAREQSTGMDKPKRDKPAKTRGEEL
jgi:hypothetical protein